MDSVTKANDSPAYHSGASGSAWLSGGTLVMLGRREGGMCSRDLTHTFFPFSLDVPTPTEGSASHDHFLLAL